MNVLTKLAVATVAAYTILHLTRRVVRQHRNFDWPHKRVIITGASRGLGLVLARHLADLGARLAICARTQSDLEAAVDELRQRGVEVVAAPCDVRDDKQVESFVAGVEDRFGGVDVLIKSAETTAEQILEACRDGRGEVFIHSPLNLSIALQNAFPEINQEILSLAASVLPEMGGIGHRAAKGHESETAWSPSVMTTSTQQAAAANNQR